MGIYSTDTEGNLVEGNFIGTNPGGSAAIGNTIGVQIATGADENTIGGTTSAARNIISGNIAQGVVIGDSTPTDTTGNVVEGNYIGTDVTGTVALGNGNENLEIDNATGTQVGGLTSTPGTGPGNVISGAGILTNYNDYGIVVTGQSGGSNIEGNIIGLNAAGDAALGNAVGIFLDTSVGVTVGGTQTGSGNIISGNVRAGVELSNGASGNVVQSNYIGTDLGGTTRKPITMASKSIPGRATISSAAMRAMRATSSISIPSMASIPTIRAVKLPRMIPSSAISCSRTESRASALTNGATAGSSTVPYVISLYTSSTSTTVVGSFTSTPNTTFDLNFFANDVGGEGEYYLGSVIVETDAGGVAYFKPSWPVASSTGQIFTATVTSLGTSGTQPTDTSPIEVLTGFTPAAHTPPTVSIAGPTTTVVGVSTVFTSTVTDSNSAQPNLTYSWTVTGPGTSALNGTGFALPDTVITDEPDFTFTPTMSGQYTVQLAISDGVSIVASNTITLNAGTAGQGVVISGLTQDVVQAGTSVPLTGTYFSGTGATAASYTWSVTANGQTYDAGNGQTFDFDYAIAGIYQVTLTVIDSNGVFSSNSVFIDVAQATAAASISISPPLAFTGMPVTAAAGGSDSGLTGPLNYEWIAYYEYFPYPSDPYYYFLEEAGSQSGSSPTFTYTPTQTGSYEFALTVSDGYGDSVTANPANFTVGNLSQPPSVSITAPSSTTVGSTISLTGNATPTTSTDTYSWTIYSSGTGTTTTGFGRQIPFTPSSAGVDVVTLEVIDGSGNEGWATADITVTPPSAALTLSPPVVTTANVSANLAASVSNPTTGVTYTFSWNVIGLDGGINPVSTATASDLVFTPEQPGNYVAIVTATGSDGSVLTAQETFTVAPVVPTVSIATLIAPTTYQQPTDAVYAGTFVAFSAEVSELDAATGPLNYSWTIAGPGGFSVTGSGPTIDFTPTQQGTSYTVSVVVTDNYGYMQVH